MYSVVLSAVISSQVFIFLHLLQLCNNSGGWFGAREGINSKATGDLFCFERFFCGFGWGFLGFFLVLLVGCFFNFFCCFFFLNLGARC